MKLVSNVEISHTKEVVISGKIFYNFNKEKESFILDEKRSKESVVASTDIAAKVVSREDMADIIRDYVGSKKWKIVLSLGTVNIVKRKKKSKKTSFEKITAELIPVVTVDEKKEKSKKK